MFNKNVKTHGNASPQQICKKCEEYLAGWKRANADYQNLQKETTKQMDEFRKYSNEDMLMQLLPLADYFNHAFKQIPVKEQNSPWLTGIKHIQNYFNKILQDNGVEEIKVLGEEFDPAKHEIVAEEESDQEEGKIIKVNQAGFTLQGKVIRPAKVIISKQKKGGGK
ncbi:MAG: nucleotide exchange factor GrpE [Patescibacteria group bacterium]|jgi:molecular chaperone GrpE